MKLRDLASSAGRVFFYIAADPDCTVKQIAEGLCLTERTVWGVTGSLQKAEIISVRRENKRNHYQIHERFNKRTLLDLAREMNDEE